MFSNWKQTMYDVKDGIETQHKLVGAYLIWSALCVYWGTYNNIDIYQFYGPELSVADLLILQQHDYFAGITIFPFAAFLIMKCKENSLNVQYILRYGDRKCTLQKQIIESIWYSLILSVLLVAMQVLFAWIKTGNLINWDSFDSLYYYKIGEFTDTNVLWVIIGVMLMYFIKLLIVFVCIDLLMWYPKVIFLVWVALILVVGIELFAERQVFHLLFSVKYELWSNPFRQFAYLGFGAVYVGIQYLVGRILVKRKDIFH